VVLLASCCVLLAAGCNNFNAQGRNAQGVAFYQQGRLQEAVQEFQEATYADPQNPDGYYNLAAAYHRLGRTQNQSADLARAETYYRQCLDRNPNHRDAHRGLAVLLAEQCRTEEAFRSLESWAAQQPRLADPKVELARLHEEFGNQAAAKERLIEALSVDPNNARQWAALGRIRERQGELPQALANYQRSLQLDNAQPQVASRVAALQGTTATTAAAGGTTAATTAPTAWR
jgi:tetratricopeptide (TPR) repeat protein